MGPLEHKVRLAQRRLWLNRWLRYLGWTTAAASAIAILLIVVDRTFAFELRLSPWVSGLAVVALIASIVMAFRRRESNHVAAAELDIAAGLKERISSALYCRAAGDPFSDAVVADADRAAAGLGVRQFIPIRWTHSLTYAAIGLVLGLLLVWLFPNLDVLGKAQAREQRAAERLAARNVRQAIAAPVEAIKTLAATNPELKDLSDLADLEKLSHGADAPNNPSDLRRDAIKKLESLGDALRKKTEGNRFADYQDVKRRLSELTQPADPQTSAGKLSQALADGDFKSAQNEIKKLREELAKRQHAGASPEDVKRLAEQLDSLADKLKDLEIDPKLRDELKRAGLSKEELKRTLEALAKKDPKQLEKMARDLEKRLKDTGMSKQKIDQFKKKLADAAKRQSSQKSIGKMSSALKNASQCCKNGDTQGAGEQLDQAGEQLSQMEMLEQQLGEINSKMSEVDQLKEDLGQDNPDDNGVCPECNGTGFRKDGSPCAHCNGSGRSGQGRGSGRRPRGSGDVAFVQRRSKIKQRKGGQIIAQWFVKGEQLKGEAQASYQQAAEAAVRDAADALDKDQVPRAYQHAVKAYFDRLPDAAPDKPPPEKKP